MGSDYKSSKEAFVSGLAGSTIMHINLISLVALPTIALHSTIFRRISISNPWKIFALEWTLVVLPLLLCMTLFAFRPVTLSLILLGPIALFGLVWSVGQQDPPLPSSFSKKELGAPSSPEPKPTATIATTKESLQPLPALSVYRAHMLIMTMLAILAVDFPVFPRALAKTETWGTSLMDLGVGSFVFSQGLVSAIPLLKDTSYLTAPLFPKLLNTTRKTVPVLILGLIRVVMIKGTELPEHETEYGRHWSFYITLALLPPMQILLHPVLARMPVSLLGALVALTHEIILSLGAQEFVLNSSRTDLLSANKEGVVSLMGYFAIHLLGLSAGTVVLPASPSYFRRRQRDMSSNQVRKAHDPDPSQRTGKSDGKPNNSQIRSRETMKTASELCAYSVVWWVLLAITLSLGFKVSRRMANLPYVLWAVAFNTTYLLGYLLLVEGFSGKLNVTPILLEAINKNGLVLFLAANLLTGLVNLSIQTMYTSDVWAMGILSSYSLVLCAFAWVVRRKRIW